MGPEVGIKSITFKDSGDFGITFVQVELTDGKKKSFCHRLAAKKNAKTIVFQSNKDIGKVAMGESGDLEGRNGNVYKAEFYNRANELIGEYNPTKMLETCSECSLTEEM